MSDFRVGEGVVWQTTRTPNPTEVRGTVVRGTCAETGVPVQRKVIDVTLPDGSHVISPVIGDSGYTCVGSQNLHRLTNGR